MNSRLMRWAPLLVVVGGGSTGWSSRPQRLPVPLTYGSNRIVVQATAEGFTDATRNVTITRNWTRDRQSGPPGLRGTAALAPPCHISADEPLDSNVELRLGSASSSSFILMVVLIAVFYASNHTSLDAALSSPTRPDVVQARTLSLRERRSRSASSGIQPIASLRRGRLYRSG